MDRDSGGRRRAMVVTRPMEEAPPPIDASPAEGALNDPPTEPAPRTPKEQLKRIQRKILRSEHQIQMLRVSIRRAQSLDERRRAEGDRILLDREKKRLKELKKQAAALKQEVLGPDFRVE